MTETELIDLMVTNNANARAVLVFLASYSTVNGDVTVTLRDGTSITVPSIPKQNAQATANFNTLKTGWHQDFAGAFVGQTVDRASNGVINSVTTNFTSGWKVTESFTRNADNRIATITATVRDETNTQIATATRTLTYSNGRYVAMA